MNGSEFRNEFNILYNNITSNQAPGLNDYEISVFLTKAQEELIKNYFNPAGNKFKQGFDGSIKRQYDFSPLMEVNRTSDKIILPSYNKCNINSECFALPDNCFLIVNEEIDGTDSYGNSFTYPVLPISYMEYTLYSSKPYRYPLKNQAWRLINSSNDSNAVEILAHPFENILSYMCRYVKKPSPIIISNLADIDEDLSIGGFTEAKECILNEDIQDEIIQRAVELAKAAWQGDLQASLTIGNRSE